MSGELPPRPNLEHLKKQAKALLADFARGDRAVVEKFRALKKADAPKLADAQRAVAREYGFASWAKLKAHVESVAAPAANPVELIKAAFHNQDAAKLRALLGKYPELKPRVNEPVFSFDSPAIIHVHTPEMLDVLLEAGADISAKSKWWAGGFGILHGAEPKLAEYAISRGAIVDIHAAARLGKMERVRELIASDPSLVHARGGDGQMPLHFASTVEIAGYLLDHGAEIDALDIDHESTPAQWMLKERADVARYLVGRGARTDILMAAALGDLERVRAFTDADPKAIETSVTLENFPKINPRAGGTIYIWTLGWNKTPHMVAREFGHEDVFRLLMERSSAEVKVAQACELGDEETFNAMLARDPGLVRKLTDADRRKVVDAAQNNNTRAVALMLKAGWPVDARGQHRGMALHWAAFHGNAAMTKEILTYRPPIDDADNEFKSSPLGWATHGSEHGWYCKTGDYVGTVELLCAAGAKLPKELKGTEQVKAILRRYKEGAKPSLP